MAKCTCDPVPQRPGRAAHRRTQYGDPYENIHHIDTRCEMVDAARGAYGNDIYVFKNGDGDRIELARIHSHDREPRWRLAANGGMVEPPCAKTAMIRMHRWTLQLFEMIDEGVPFSMLPR